MDNFLKQSIEHRRLAFQQTAEALGISIQSVEKDFWVCWTLRELFALPELGEQLTFKGGTSLSKAWHLIHRFSEDIDLTIGREYLGFGGEQSPEEAPSNKQQSKRLKALKAASQQAIMERLLPALSARIGSAFPPDFKWTLAPDDTDADGQTLLFRYPVVVPIAISRYIRPEVKIEMGARSDTWPADSVVIRPFVAENFPQAMPSADCPVQVLAAERTFWEKAMLLHELRGRPAGKTIRPRMARHYYDLWCLIGAGVAARAMRDTDLYRRVATHRSVFFPVTGVDYDALRDGELQLMPLPKQLDNWRKDYQAMRGSMFIGAAPSFDDVLASVRQFEHDFNKK